MDGDEPSGEAARPEGDAAPEGRGDLMKQLHSLSEMADRLAGLLRDEGDLDGAMRVNRFAAELVHAGFRRVRMYSPGLHGRKTS